MLWTQRDRYCAERFEKESDPEDAVREVNQDLFGPNRIYLDVKKKIGAKQKTNNIPDGYLIDLTSTKNPVLRVVENELAEHDPLRHVAIQILKFTLSYEATPQKVKSIVKAALQADDSAWQKCEQYAKVNNFENVDYLLEQMIYNGEFSALVLTDELSSVLTSRFKFGVEIITLARYKNSKGERIYEFDPFLADLTVAGAAAAGASSAGAGGQVDLSEVDTVVVPGREEGFNEVFLDEQRWRAIRIHGSMIPKIKYIAAYQVAPTSAITHIAPVRSIEPWADTGKYMISFAEPTREIEPIRLVPHGKVKAPQNLR